MVEEVIRAAVGMGVFISLIFSELLGASAGGIVVPGYIAMFLHRPLFIVATIVVSLVTLLAIRTISLFTIVYGRRRLALCILLGFIFGWLSKPLLADVTVGGAEVQSIGFIIPGLIANWMERQGIIKTISVMLLAAVIVRLLLIIIFPGRF